MSDFAPLEEMTVLVTGGHGFIGRHVVAALARVGATPLSTVHPEGSELTDLPGVTISVDLEEVDQVSEAMRDVDMVIHLAARAGGIQFQEGGDTSIFASNRRITDNVLRACVRARVNRLLIASSSVIYQPSDEPISESWPVLGPADHPDPYSWSKITDEVATRWHENLHTVVGRFGNVYGPGASFERDRSTVIHGLIDRAARARDQDDLVVWGDGTAVRSFVYVEDAARAVLIALEKGQLGEAYNIDSGVGATIAELATYVRDAVNPSLVLRFDAAKPAGMPFRVGSVAKLAALGYAPTVGLADGVRRTFDWYRGSVGSNGVEGSAAQGWGGESTTMLADS